MSRDTKPRSATGRLSGRTRQTSAVRDDPIRNILHAEPMAVLIDRSKDSFSGGHLRILIPASVFMVTETHVRLSARVLADYDVLVVFGNSTTRYIKSELTAIDAFVRGGGGLVIAACSGQFEQTTERQASNMAANAVAGLFGFEFLSAGELPTDVNAVRGYDRARLALTASGERLGLRLGELPLGRPGPLAVPRGAQVLLGDKKTGQPVSALSRCGRGRVLVCNDTAIWDDRGRWASAHWLMAVAPKRRSQKRRPTDEIDSRTWQETRRNRIVVRSASDTRGRVQLLTELARDVREEVQNLLQPGSEVRVWRIELRPGCGEEMPGDDEGEVRSVIGSSLRPAAMAAALARHLGRHFLRPRWQRGVHEFVQQAVCGLEICVLERLGFAQYAASLRGALEGAPSVDLGRGYTLDFGAKLAECRRFWLAAVDQFGDDVFGRFLQAVSAQDIWKGIDEGVFSPFDVLAFLLATAQGEPVYEWIEERGYTVRRIPLERPGSDGLRRSVGNLLETLLAASDEPASERFGALSALIRQLEHERASLHQCVRRARSKRPAAALPAAGRLLAVRDARGEGCLRPCLRNRDPGLAAVAALLMTFETEDADAAETLVRLAPKQDARFQLSAGHALKLAGHPRAGEFTFDRVSGCHLEVVEDGAVSVFAVVHGYEVAHVISVPVFMSEPYGRAHSSYYVASVYTDARWRRRGLARVCMAKNLEHRWALVCAAMGLGTGTRNVAHRLYRSFGLIDYQRGQSFIKAIRPEPPVKPPKGIRVRRARPEDAPAATELLNQHFEAQACERFRLTGWPGDRVSWVAYQGDRLMGVATARLSGRRADLEHVAVEVVRDKRGKRVGKLRALLGHALLNAVHRDLLRKGANSIGTGPWSMPLTEGLSWALTRQGYGSRRSDGVSMRRINDLAQYLDEIAPVLVRRLAHNKRWADWQGSIQIEGMRLAARLEIDRGQVLVVPHLNQKTAARAGRRSSIVLRADDLAIQRMVLGVEHPFEEYLQMNAAVTPHLNDNARDLLETLFPMQVFK